MRPLIAHNAGGYVIPANIQINTAKIKNLLATQGINPVLGTSTFVVATLLTFLGQMAANNGGQAKWAGLNANQKKLVPLLIKLFSDSKSTGYGRSRMYLIQNFGQICSYCETVVQDSALAVEHILPKSEFPDEMLTYANFYLSCPSCNSKKGAKPTYQSGRAWAINQGGIPFPTYLQIKTGALDLSTRPTDATAYTGFSFTLFDYNGNAIPQANSVNVANSWISTTNNQVTANVNGAPNPITVKSQFAGTGLGTPLMRNQNFIQLVGINDTTPGPTGASDRRVVNRTVAWFDAIAAYNRLATVFNNDPTPNKDLFKILLGQVMVTIRSAGFYSTWAYIFNVLSPPPNIYSLYTYLKNMTSNNAQPQYYIVGTNAALMP